MYNSNIPSDRELPSTSKLIKSTLLALTVALIILVTIVMPAEYGIDPTGFGKLSGLQTMGEIRVSLEAEAAQEQGAAQSVSTPEVSATIKPLDNSQIETVDAAIPKKESVTPQLQSDTVMFSLVPNEGVEIKVALDKGKTVNYEWISTGKINFDIHGDSKTLNIDYHGYGKGFGQTSDMGSIEAAFDGKHGWFWRNRTKETVDVTLTMNGEYSSIDGLD